MGPTYKIAELLKISFREAVAYCEEVRSASGLGPALHYKTIAQHLEQHLPEVPSAKSMAEIVKENKLLKPSPRNTQPKKVKRQVLTKPVKQNSRRVRKRGKRSKFEWPKRPAPLPTYLVRTSYFDQERVSEQKLEHCPHGVPHGRVCAICDPKKFREMTGMD